MKAIHASICPLLVHGAVAFVTAGCSAGAERVGPRGPARESQQPALDELAVSHPEYFLVARLDGQGPDFSSRFSQDLFERLKREEKHCSIELLTAQREAFRSHALHAGRSFRNCVIRDGRAWIREQLEKFRQSVDARNRERALVHLGAALASLQAFYTYSNYVELLEEQGMSWSSALDAPHRVWSSGPLLVDEARLQSDFSPSIRRNDCPAAPPRLEKLTRDSPAGSRPLTKWSVLAHEAAYQLALEDSQAMVAQAWEDRPWIREACGSKLVIGYPEVE